MSFPYDSGTSLWLPRKKLPARSIATTCTGVAESAPQRILTSTLAMVTPRPWASRHACMHCAHTLAVVLVIACTQSAWALLGPAGVTPCEGECTTLSLAAGTIEGELRKEQGVVHFLGVPFVSVIEDAFLDLSPFLSIVSLSSIGPAWAPSHPSLHIPSCWQCTSTVVSAI